MFRKANRVDDQAEQRRQLEKLERELDRLTEAIATGGDIPAIVERLRTTEAKRRDLLARLGTGATMAGAATWREIEHRIRRSLIDWRSLLLGDVAQA